MKFRLLHSRTRRTVFLLLSLLLFVGQASANNITIVNHTVNDDGTPKFLTFFWNLCVQANQTRCTNNSLAMQNITWAAGGNTMYNMNDYGYQQTIAPLNSAGIYWAADANLSGNSMLLDNLSVWEPFFGYFICDECGTSWKPTQPWGYGSLRYNNSRAYDDYNHTTYSDNVINMSTMVNQSDIVVYDGYSHTAGADETWNISDWIYAKEYRIYDNWIKGYIPNDCPSCEELTDIPENKTAMIMGEAWHSPSYNDGVYTYYPLTSNESRAETYAWITMGVRGVGWYSYEYVSSSIGGIRGNASQVSQYDNLAGEILSIEPILLMNTSNYSWGANRTDNRVTFSNNPTKEVEYNGVHTFHYLNYMLKENSTHKYLIIVNKDQNATTTSVNISGTSGITTATTLGIVGTGSSAPGRTITVTNGNFTDTIDGYGAHIYEIPVLNISFNSSTPNNNSIINTNYINVTTDISCDTYCTSWFDWNHSNVLDMRFNDGDGRDSSSYQNNGTVSGATVNSSGKFGSAMDFDGINDKVSIGTNTSLNSSAYTLEAWFRTTNNSVDTTVGERIISIKRTSPSTRIALMMRNNRSQLIWINNTGATIELSSNVTSNDGSWHHVIGTTNGTAFSIYLDGVLKNQTTSSLNDTYYEITIGALNSSGYFNGTLDNIKIFNYVLSSQEVLALYNATANQLYRNFTNLTDGSHNATAYIQNVAGDIAQTETRYWIVTASEAQFTKVEFLWWD